MVSLTLPAVNPKSWAKAIAQPAPEFALTSLSVLAGQIPAGLQGSLYRNGPGRLERNGVRVKHWFDGDGAILAVHFANQQATATYRYVRSAGYQAEEAAGEYLYSSYGTVAPGRLWERWQKQFKNAANTSVLALGDRLLALWEGGHPHQLDLQTLETWGVESFDRLSANCTYSAHPKIEATTGDIYNFGVVPGANATLNLYRSDRSGRILKQNAIPLNGVPLIHDFALAGQYLVFIVPPVRLNTLPAVLGFASFSDCLMWQPKRGTQIVTIDRQSLEVVSYGETDAWFQWHIGKSYQDFDGNVVIELVRYPDLTTNQHLSEIASGQIKSKVNGQLWQMRLNPQTGTVLEQLPLVERGCEFPVFPQGASDLDLAPTYLSIRRAETTSHEELFNAIARFDPQTATLTVADAGENCYPSEPIYVPQPQDPTQGWILTVVYDGDRHVSEVWIYQSDRLDQAPICRLALPSVIPHSFHGTWRPA
ncbi:MAG: carotenoid oxygenase family protein [Almyronema sp.]